MNSNESDLFANVHSRHAWMLLLLTAVAQLKLTSAEFCETEERIPMLRDSLTWHGITFRTERFTSRMRPSLSRASLDPGGQRRSGRIHRPVRSSGANHSPSPASARSPVSRKRRLNSGLPATTNASSAASTLRLRTTPAAANPELRSASPPLARSRPNTASSSPPTVGRWFYLSRSNPRSISPPTRTTASSTDPKAIAPSHRGESRLLHEYRWLRLPLSPIILSLGLVSIDLGDVLQ